MKYLPSLVVLMMSAAPVFADTVYSDPVQSDVATTSVHGSLPGGDKTRWSTQEGTTNYSDWAAVDTTVTGNTTVVTETREAVREDEALNPASRTVGTARFDPTTTWTETRTATTVTEPTTGGNPNCTGSCGIGNGGNGTGNEGGGKPKK